MSSLLIADREAACSSEEQGTGAEASNWFF
jgi:hypothetical protein